MGRIVAIGGGTLEEIKPINKYALELTGKAKPNVLFVPTASRDNDVYIRDFQEALREYGCEVKNLLLTKNTYAENQIDELIKWADLIYIGGGNTVHMMNVWKRVNFSDKLREVFHTDSAVLVGQGSGCLCWFYCGYSNSTYTDGRTDWQYIWADNLLDFHHVAVCPHYSDQDRLNFDKRLLEKEVPGFGLEDNTAFVQIGHHTEFVSGTENARAFYLVYLNGELHKTEIKMKKLTGPAENEGEG